MATLSIELDRNPAHPATKTILAYTDDWTCEKCGKHTVIIAADWVCVFCAIDKAGKDSIIVAGWLLSKSAGGQINANRLA